MTATRFKTKIVEIEAFRYLPDAVDELIEWSESNFRLSNVRDDGANALEFTGMIYDKLHVAWIPVKVGQWIVRGAKGEYCPCDDETFHWKYEPVVDPDFSLTGTLEYRDGEVTAEGFEMIAGPHKDHDEPVRFEG